MHYLCVSVPPNAIGNLLLLNNLLVSDHSSAFSYRKVGIGSLDVRKDLRTHESNASTIQKN